jgi:CubicO group peptidase (beta-lactamase class C family)
MVKKIFKSIAWVVLIIFLLINLTIVFSGKLWIYKALIYNYVNIDDLDLFHNRPVKAGKVQPWPQHSKNGAVKLNQALINELEKNETVEFVVIKNDSLIYESYWDGYTANSISNPFSASKSITALAVGFALDEGKIQSLDDKVNKYLPYFKEGQLANVTIRHLLWMSSGVDWDEQYASLLSPTTEAYYGSDLEGMMKKLKPLNQPGKIWNYKACDTQLLAHVVQQATGKKLADYLSEKLWIPIGAEHDAQWSLDHYDGMEKASCCCYATARDLARIGLLMLHHGNWKGTQILSAAYVKESITPAPLVDTDGNENVPYGYQWWTISVGGVEAFYARGIGGQYIFVIPDHQLVMVRLGRKRGVPIANHAVSDIVVYLEEGIRTFKEL